MKISPILIAIFIALPFAPPADAQTADDSTASSTFFGVTGGAGIGTLGFAGLGNLFVRFDSHIITLRAAGTAELFGNEFYDAGLLYGHRFTLVKNLTLNTLAGIGLMGGTRGGSIFHSGASIATRLSVPLEAEAIFTPFDFLGIGLCGFGDLNSEQSFDGILVAVQVGSLR